MVEVEIACFEDTANLSLPEAVDRAISRIAPTWPLDQFLAVNPYWGFRDQPIDHVAHQLSRLSGSPMLMPHAFYRQQWIEGSLRREHVDAAVEGAREVCTTDEVLAHLNSKDAPPRRLPLVTYLMDQQRDLLHGLSVHDFVAHNISQHCAAYFDTAQARWHAVPCSGLYQDWLRHITADHAPRLLMGLGGVKRQAAMLNDDSYGLIEFALTEMKVPATIWESYLTALLLSINGWAAWCAYRRWQAALSGTSDDSIVHLLAIRLAWEWLLFSVQDREKIQALWREHWAEQDFAVDRPGHNEQLDWVLQDALERSYQDPLCQALAGQSPSLAPKPKAIPAVQAIFCIDVRSEVFRRALEACGPQIQTLGFAGFFGIPISYQPLGTSMLRPQLPGLLAPSLTVTERGKSLAFEVDVSRRRGQRMSSRRMWREFTSASISIFSFVESCGIAYAAKLLKASLPSQSKVLGSDHFGLTATETVGLRPMIQTKQGSDHRVTIKEHCALAAQILRGMNLTASFGRLVLLAGHGSHSTNNAHASGLDCGACCGQTGEVNARTVAALLNQSDVRDGLRREGIEIPIETIFLAGLHNTTTDMMDLFDTELVPVTHTNDLEQLIEWLSMAGARARTERAPSLGLSHLVNKPASLKKAMQIRANDWSQVRPEWGLANNAAFIVAPRTRTKGICLNGRAFLHEYDAMHDRNFSTLEAIMTAPMVVTNWINMQYYASTVDNEGYGSGNKVLHNVVGGRLGVFEGNGGDLRIGLPLQSLSDGQHLRHLPLRLSVFIEAPQDAIATVIRNHDDVRHLVDHSWIHLFQIEPSGRAISRYRNGEWVA